MVVALAAIATASPVSAQSLAEVARHEEARRNSVTKAAKTLTNADLKLDGTVAAPAAAAAPAGGYLSVTKGRYVTAEEIIAITNDNHVKAELAAAEPNWRRQAGTIRSQLLKAQQEVAAMSTTAAAVDRSPGERAAAAKLLIRQQAVLADLESQWESFVKEAGKVRIPQAWLEPIPTLATRNPR